MTAEPVAARGALPYAPRMTRLPLAFTLLLALGPLAAADEPPLPRLGLRFEPQRPEVYDVTVELDGEFDVELGGETDHGCRYEVTIRWKRLGAEPAPASAPR